MNPKDLPVECSFLDIHYYNRIISNVTESELNMTDDG